MTATYKSMALFGGAITASIPSSYTDVSEIRDIPDNQEVHLDSKGLTSIIIEILEYASPPDHPCSTDEEALKYHYADMVTVGYTTARVDEEESTTFYSAGDVSMPLLAQLDRDLPVTRERKRTARIWSIVGMQTPLQVDAERKVDFTVLLTTLVRLPAKDTDILITVSVPHAKGEYDASAINMEEENRGALVETGMQISKELLRTFEIIDWNLFDG